MRRERGLVVMIAVGLNGYVLAELRGPVGLLVSRMLVMEVFGKLLLHRVLVLAILSSSSQKGL
jgi:hypothetical protein